MLWTKAFHIIFVTSWMAALLYLPRLFVYHSLCDDKVGHDRFLIMERKLYYGIMWPAAVLSLAFGIWTVVLGWPAFGSSWWLYLKFALVLCMFIFHFYCGSWYRAFKRGKNRHSHKFFRWVNEIPIVLFILIAILVVVKPFGMIQQKCGVQILETSYSPDSIKTAVIFSSDCFESAKNAIHISIHNSSEKFSDEKGNALIIVPRDQKKIDLKWSKEDLVSIQFSREAQVLFSAGSYEGVRIEAQPIGTRPQH